MLPLPHLSAAEAGYLNRLARHGGTQPVTFLEATWLLRLRPCPGDDAADPAAWLIAPFYLTIDLGGSRLVLAVDQTVFAELLRTVDPGGEPSLLPEPLLVALTELAAGELAEALERAFGHAVRIVAAGSQPPAEAGPHRVALSLRRADGGRTVEAVLLLDQRALALVAELAGRLPERESEASGDWDHLPVPLRLDVGWVDLPVADLAGLSRQDILLLDETTLLDENRLILRATGLTGLRARLDGSTLIIEDIVRTTMSEDPADPPAAAPDPASATDGEAEPLLGSLDQVEVRLTFDIGHQLLTLADLRGLRPGTSFDLGRDPRRAVNIRANGKLIGNGELVRIDDRVGVRIVSLGTAE